MRNSLVYLKFISITFIIFFSRMEASASNLLFSGYVNYTYISRLSDGSLIDIPYRMSSLNFEKRNDNISLNGNFSIEYHLRDDAYFLGSSDPQDFILELESKFIRGVVLMRIVQLIMQVALIIITYSSAGSREKWLHYPLHWTIT